MTDITRPALLYLKAALFCVLGSLAALLLLWQRPPTDALLLALTVWAFARAYYFVFYVIEHYIDPGYRYAGLWDFYRYVARGRRRGE